MKKIVWLIAFCLLLTVSCKTKHVTTRQQGQKTDLSERLIQQEESTQQISVSSEQIQTEIKELQELISNINVSFDGKEIDDKLDILLKKTNDGTKLTFQGKGNVNYSENIKSDIQTLKNEVIKRQDSVISTLNLKLQNLELKIDHYFKEKDKEVKTKGVSFGGYLSLILWILLLVVLMFLAWRLKLFRKITAIITKFKRLLKNI